MHRHDWIETYRQTQHASEYSPRELRAQAMALMVFGYSSRRIEKHLKRMFPGKAVPNWSTIARWNRSRPPNRLGEQKLRDVSARAADILADRIERLDATTPDGLMLLMRVYATTRDLLTPLPRSSAPGCAAPLTK